MGDAKPLFIEGPAGMLEAALREADDPKGAVVLAHPHPLYGGTLNNPVVFHARPASSTAQASPRCGSIFAGSSEATAPMTKVAARSATSPPPRSGSRRWPRKAADPRWLFVRLALRDRSRYLGPDDRRGYRDRAAASHLELRSSGASPPARRGAGNEGRIRVDRGDRVADRAPDASGPPLSGSRSDASISGARPEAAALVVQAADAMLQDSGAGLVDRVRSRQRGDHVVADVLPADDVRESALAPSASGAAHALRKRAASSPKRASPRPGP